MEKYLVYEKEHHSGGIRKLYKFPNGYGASVIKTPFSYGGFQDLWELAVVTNIADDNSSFDLCYTTTITNDVLGYLSDEDVENVLKQIMELEE